jgi:pre-mRNA-processing factor 19
VFEKRLVEAYIAENGKDPVTGEELSTDDLIEVKSQRVVRPRPPTLTSIPSLLSVFQEEWDALALETYTLRQNLAQTRQELSAALYQHDAAVRVIARLTQERDEARDALSKVTVGARASGATGDAMQVDSTGLPEQVLTRVESTQASYVYPTHPSVVLFSEYKSDFRQAFQVQTQASCPRRLGNKRSHFRVQAHREHRSLLPQRQGVIS